MDDEILLRAAADAYWDVEREFAYKRWGTKSLPFVSLPNEKRRLLVEGMRAALAVFDEYRSKQNN